MDSQKIKAILRRYNELWLGPIGIILFLISARVVKFLDPEAVSYTADAFQKIIFGHLVFAACIFSAWLALRLTWPSVFRYLVDDFNDDFSSLGKSYVTTNQKNEKCEVKLFLALSLLALYVLGLIACMHVL